MNRPILVGVDGGGTRCRVRARFADGTSIGEAEGGSANIFSDMDGALANIVAVTEKALAALGLGRADLARCHVGLGLAGANLPAIASELERRQFPFASHALESDAVVACRGAHSRRNGAIAIIGTGTAYVLRTGGDFVSLGGWGFEISDQGSSADLGRRALAAALLSLDGLGPVSPLTMAILERFGHDAPALVLFARSASPGAFGGFATLVVDHAEAGDAVAEEIVLHGQHRIEAALERLLFLGAPSIVLLGGLSARYRARLAPALRRSLLEPEGDALDGALMLAATLLPQADR